MDISLTFLLNSWQIRIKYWTPNLWKYQHLQLNKTSSLSVGAELRASWFITIKPIIVSKLTSVALTHAGFMLEITFLRSDLSNPSRNVDLWINWCYHLQVHRRSLVKSKVVHMLCNMEILRKLASVMLPTSIHIHKNSSHSCQLMVWITFTVKYTHIQRRIPTLMMASRAFSTHNRLRHMSTLQYLLLVLMSYFQLWKKWMLNCLSVMKTRKRWYLRMTLYALILKDLPLHPLLVHQPKLQLLPVSLRLDL